MELFLFDKLFANRDNEIKKKFIIPLPLKPSGFHRINLTNFLDKGHLLFLTPNQLNQKSR